ncbi:MAG: hypothetical protein HQL57_08475 [Magnetococcales bacterium]|nr:hypothetical protein [Magnetococcales bacterium]
MRFLIEVLVRVRFTIGIGALYIAPILLFFRLLIMIFFLTSFSNQWGCWIGHYCNVWELVIFYWVISVAAILAAIFFLLISRIALGEWRPGVVIALCVQSIIIIFQGVSQTIAGFSYLDERIRSLSGEGPFLII